MLKSKKLTISNLEFEVNPKTDKIYIRDAKVGTFIMRAALFKKEIETKLELLKNQDGAVRIDDDLYLCLYIIRDKNKYFIFLCNNKSVKSKLYAFLKNCA